MGTLFAKITHRTGYGFTLPQADHRGRLRPSIYYKPKLLNILNLQLSQHMSLLSYTISDWFYNDRIFHSTNREVDYVLIDLHLIAWMVRVHTHSGHKHTTQQDVIMDLLSVSKISTIYLF